MIYGDSDCVAESLCRGQSRGKMFGRKEGTEIATAALGLRPSTRPWYAKSREAIPFIRLRSLLNDYMIHPIYLYN
jgi:hypothetical protein